jgi:hypothetical protein
MTEVRPFRIDIPEEGSRRTEAAPPRHTLARCGNSWRLDAGYSARLREGRLRALGRAEALRPLATQRRERARGRSSGSPLAVGETFPEALT